MIFTEAHQVFSENCICGNTASLDWKGRREYEIEEALGPLKFFWEKGDWATNKGMEKNEWLKASRGSQRMEPRTIENYSQPLKPNQTFNIWPDEYQSCYGSVGSLCLLFSTYFKEKYL